MIVIGTDEAGYGPKLGPLVIAASTWELPPIDDDPDTLREAFSMLTSPVNVGGVKIRIDDSKTVFHSASSGKRSVGYRGLELAALAGCRWCGLAADRLQITSTLCPLDHDVIASTPWLAAFAMESIPTDPSASLEAVWRNGAARLIGLQSRVITAGTFNRICERGLNKSDLLSMLTLQLVKNQLEQIHWPCADPITVYCDRHGGRRFYAGPLQSVFDDGWVQADCETASVSKYRVPFRDGSFSIQFSVKGDAFTPVAFSSMIAKYLREKSMESINRYFKALHPSMDTLRPTAGYPVDADRFLNDIEPLLIERQIDRRDLVRTR